MRAVLFVSRAAGRAAFSATLAAGAAGSAV